jgi:hypothetical protein
VLDDFDVDRNAARLAERIRRASREPGDGAPTDPAGNATIREPAA